MRLTRWMPAQGQFPEWIDAQSQADNSMSVDVVETENGYELTAELAGVAIEDIKVTVEDDTLSIEAEKKSETEKTNEGGYVRERLYGKFRRSFRLSGQVGADKIGASYVNGVLRLSLPKREEVKSRAVEVKIGKEIKIGK